MKGIDTTFLIDVLRNDNAAVLKSLELDKETIVFTTESCVYELVSGICRQKTNKERLMHDMETILNKMTVLPLDHKAAVKAGEISANLTEKGRIIDDIDCLTAGILLTNGCNNIVTRNVRHFERIDNLKVENY
ncbi:MAG: type II toxin-antitoxin system VapC family toxin [Candidatus Aenigmarchaeota archaeon]|nr:type II toxin-antitoxin system VapC family toxin [Candidatus Aenigmarchaeota archaeon]